MNLELLTKRHFRLAQELDIELCLASAVEATSHDGTTVTPMPPTE